MPDTINVTAITKLKHTELLELSRLFGGVRQLAIHLGISPAILYKWVSLQQTPPERPSKSPYWPDSRIDALERDLLLLTEKTLEELFPQALVSAVVAGIPKSREDRREIETGALLGYATRTSLRLEYPDQDARLDNELLSEKCRQCLPPREKTAIYLRYDQGKTLAEAGVAMRTSRERIRQLESKALKRMQRWADSQGLTSRDLYTETAPVG
jgi:hypothetical protein